MHKDLLALAKRLALLEPRRPKQVNLRRAVSTAYYGLFHYLVDQSCRRVMGGQHPQVPYRRVLARSFSHADMKSACKSFAGGTLKKGAAEGLPRGFSIPKEIQQIATTFVDLQERRHVADYDFTETFTRSEALAAVREIRIAIRRFHKLANSNEKKFFLACLWAWKTLADR